MHSCDEPLHLRSLQIGSVGMFSRVNKGIGRNVHKWFQDQPYQFFAMGILTLVDQWDKCIRVEGVMKRNYENFMYCIYVSTDFMVLCLFTY